MIPLSRRSFFEIVGKAAVGSALCGSQSIPYVYAQESSGEELAFLSATDLCRMLREGRISSVELTRYFIDRIERYDGAINCMVVRDFERALEAAERADLSLSRNNILGPLHGLPMSVKEAYDVEGLPTTWGDPRFAANIATEDSAVVSSYRAAGAILLGKTNVPLKLQDYQSFNDIYGQTNNPWDLARVPGGSSGGSAAALATGLTALESGTDIGGSLRNPAHCCGVFGHKPTWGIVPQRGYAAPGASRSDIRDLDVVGPMARSAEDLAMALDVIAEAEDIHSPAWQLELPRARATSLADYRVAVWASHPLSPPESTIVDRIQQIADDLARLGARVSDTARPDFDVRDGHVAYVNLLGSVGVADLSEAELQAQRDLLAQFDPEDDSFWPLVLRAAFLDHRAWAQANDTRNNLRQRWSEFFSEWDIVLCPISVTTAPPHDHTPGPFRTVTVDEAVRPYYDQIFWAGLATASYLPSTAFPTGLSPGGLPIGLQAIGPAYFDRTTIEFARLLTMELGGFSVPPGYSG